MAQAARSMVPHPPGVKDGDSGWARIREQNARYWPRFSTRRPRRASARFTVHSKLRSEVFQVDPSLTFASISIQSSWLSIAHLQAETFQPEGYRCSVRGDKISRHSANYYYPPDITP